MRISTQPRTPRSPPPSSCRALALALAVLQVFPETQRHLHPTRRKQEAPWRKPDPHHGPQGTGRADLGMILVFKREIIL